MQPETVAKPDLAKPTNYRAPVADRQSLVVPTLNVALRRASEYGLPDLQLAGRSLHRLRLDARKEAQAAAWRYSTSYRTIASELKPASTSAKPGGPVHSSVVEEPLWLLAGHQPELFHPGVWFKNFVLDHARQSRTAKAVAGYETNRSQDSDVERSILPLNLVIDNDLCRAPAIRVLARDGSSFRIESVAFDAPSPPIAWECRSLLDRSLFESFPSRVKQSLVADIRTPLVDSLWRYATDAAQRTGRLGEAIAQARHRLEADFGLQTLELPLSQLCQQAAFARFSLEILTNLPKFQAIYNQQRSQYRLANGIRSQSHPVPALGSRHGWFEAPWWVFRHAEPTRRKLFARIQGDDLLLSDQAGWQTTIEGPLDSDDAVWDWQQQIVDGVLLRPRALMTTMFVRLVLSDLFLHGIGGGKYDQMTDAIMAHYFGIDPPCMMVATATVRLPLRIDSTLGTLESNQYASQHEQLSARDMRYHPEEHLHSPSTEACELLNAKQELLRNIPPRGEKWEWHRQITRINQQLAKWNQSAIEQSQSRIQQLATEQRQLKMAQSREFSFCLFEQAYLIDTLRELVTS